MLKYTFQRHKEMQSFVTATNNGGAQFPAPESHQIPSPCFSSRVKSFRLNASSSPSLSLSYSNLAPLLWVPYTFSAACEVLQDAKTRAGCFQKKTTQSPFFASVLPGHFLRDKKTHQQFMPHKAKTLRQRMTSFYDVARSFCIFKPILIK